MEVLKKLIFKEKIPFTHKTDLNKTGIVKLAGSVICLLVLGLLFFPAKSLEKTDFHERVDASGAVYSKAKDADPTNQTIQELKASQATLKTGPKPNQYGIGMSNGISAGGARGTDRNTSMIVGRSGSDTRNALSVGTRVNITLTQSLTIANQSMPVTGIVSSDVASETSLAIPAGSKVIGDASFDESGSRANLSWKTIILPDGRERQFSALSVGRDNQAGVEGNVRSDALKNTMGKMLTEFVGAYASGSMRSGMFGASDGGVQNGLKSAVSQTAQDRANSFGEDLKKEHKWIELTAGTSITAVLNQSFVFRDPGATYGR